jgi:hypothetical protein
LAHEETAQEAETAAEAEGGSMTRIIDHCFVPQAEDQLRDECAYEGCGQSELSHEWTVEAHEANPDLGGVSDVS